MISEMKSLMTGVMELNVWQKLTLTRWFIVLSSHNNNNNNNNNRLTAFVPEQPG